MDISSPPALRMVATGAAVLLQAGLEVEPVVSGVLHLLVAGAWLGGLAPLAIVLWCVSPADAGVASRSFTPLRPTTANRVVFTSRPACCGRGRCQLLPEAGSGIT